MNLPEIVRQSARSVFETMAFMTLEEGPQAEILAESEEPLAIACRVEIHGPVRGELRFWCTEEFAASATENLLGAEEEVQPSMVEDAVREIGNMIAGNIATALCRTGEVFDLSTPVVERDLPTPEERSDNEEEAAEAALYFTVDFEYPIAVAASIRHV